MLNRRWSGPGTGAQQATAATADHRELAGHAVQTIAAGQDELVIGWTPKWTAHSLRIDGLLHSGARTVVLGDIDAARRRLRRSVRSKATVFPK